MHFTIWPAPLSSNEGGYAEVSWGDFLAFVARPHIAPSKEALEGWSPARFREDRRLAANAEQISCIGLDDDVSALPLERLREIWGWCAGALHTTYSHTAAAPKWRIVLRCSREMTPTEHARVWRVVRDHAASQGQTVDEQTKDVSRFWYVPGHAAGAPYAWAELTGEPLDVDAVLAKDGGAMPPSGPKTPAATGPGEALPRAPARRLAMAAALGASWPPKGRHEAQLALAGALRGEGWPEAEALDFLCAVTRAAGDEDRPKREATVRHTYSRPADAPTTGWTRLKAHVDPVVVDAARGALGKDADFAEKIERRLAEVAAASKIPLPVEDGAITAGPFVFETGGLDAELPPLAWIVDGLICRADVCMFVAHGNSLKTWLAFSLALAVATGRPWLGRYATKRGRVAIVDFESGKYEVKRRLKLLGVEDASSRGWLLRSSYSGASLVDPETWVALAGLELELLIVDSFNAATPGDTDENDARAAALLKQAGAFAEATGCTVIVIHHARKGTGGDLREIVRGSTALFAACDRIFAFVDPEKKEGGIVLATVRSIKDGAGRTPEPLRIELSDAGLRWVEAPKEAADETSDEKLRAAALTILRAHSNGVRKANLLAQLKGKRKADVNRVVAQLETDGVTTEYREGRIVWVRLNHLVSA